MTRTELIKAIEQVEVNKTFYINAINLNVTAVGKLRRFIECGYIKPVESEVISVFNNVQAMYDCMNGKVIFPQMNYIKMRDKEFKSEV